MRVDVFDYELPPELIAQAPAEPRDASRLLVLDRVSGARSHRHFRDLPSLLAPGDCLVVNDTRVLPARLFGIRARTGGRWEGLFLRATESGWQMMTRTRGKPVPGEQIVIADGALTLEMIEKRPDGTVLVRPIAADGAVDPVELLERHGQMPIPPYIRCGQAEPADRSDYQTIFAEKPGAIAAPTASLHFTPAVLEALGQRGVGIERVTLHVGAGTFQPVAVADTADHVMHQEWCALDETVASRLRGVRAAGGRVVAVGTTAVRTLESAARAGGGSLVGFRGDTRLFLVPPEPFYVVDAMVTNFHLPRSTLLMLVCAFAGIDATLAAYREAVATGYRFYSYGDAMLLGTGLATG